MRHSVEDALRQMRLPASLTTSFHGTWRLSEFVPRTDDSAVVAVLVIYIVLGVLYESLIHPITISPGFRRPCSGRW